MFYDSASSGLLVVLECCFELQKNDRVHDLKPNLFGSVNLRAFSSL